jgi:hypothetical protein
MTTEPTTDRAAWLAQVRADLTAATTPIVQPMDGVIRQQAVERLLGVHVPGLVAALEAVEESIREWERNPMVGASSEEQWAMDTERAVARTLREDIETARSGA